MHDDLNSEQQKPTQWKQNILNPNPTSSMGYYNLYWHPFYSALNMLCNAGLELPSSGGLVLSIIRNMQIWEPLLKTGLYDGTIA